MSKRTRIIVIVAVVAVVVVAGVVAALLVFGGDEDKYVGTWLYVDSPDVQFTIKRGEDSQSGTYILTGMASTGLVSGEDAVMEQGTDGALHSKGYSEGYVVIQIRPLSNGNLGFSFKIDTEAAGLPPLREDDPAFQEHEFQRQQ